MAARCIVCGDEHCMCGAGYQPRYPIITLERKEVPFMAAHDDEFVYVTIDGHECDKDDPAVQTRYTRAEFKALDKAAMFDGAKARIVRDQQITDGVPVDAPVDAKSAHPTAAAEDHETTGGPLGRTIAHADTVKQGARK